ncbi:hypothetical protein STCU_06530 [Strigomonas culicis]|uniref:Uncharacterized protein n=1 Tax=Strigomonas culicis TaxID=28005 RepID=S9U9V5_9TRYP|nr:hypothetical protein STCU_06530 [Strigomonas culicis]|eukprot:EPY25713.1 hypothetical protein STCU_06530 [Strigomonas culicis]
MYAYTVCGMYMKLTPWLCLLFFLSSYDFFFFCRNIGVPLLVSSLACVNIHPHLPIAFLRSSLRLRPMRGGFGRNRLDKQHPSTCAIRSYAEARYPPRAYHYHQQLRPEAPGGGRPAAAAIVLPSIDADAICEPHLRVVATPSLPNARGRATVQTTTEVEKRPPPNLRDCFACYVPDAYTSGVLAWAALEPYREPLNVLHYPELLPPHGTVAAQLSALGLPTELAQVYSGGGGGGGRTVSAARLRVRPVRRPVPPRPMRRGAKVTMPSPVLGPQGAARKRPRPERLDDGGDSEDPDRGSGEDEEMSGNFFNEDDDDENGGSDDGDGRSDKGDDMYM